MPEDWEWKKQDIKVKDTVYYGQPEQNGEERDAMARQTRLPNLLDRLAL